MSKIYKNVKISEKHHDILKKYSEKNGMKIYKVLEKWIETLTNVKSKDIYGE